MHSLTVKLGKRSYSIKIGSGILVKTGDFLSGLSIGKNAVIITNPKIRRLYGRVLKKSLAKKKIDASIITVPDSEKSKSYAVFSNTINRIADVDKGKKPFIIAFGGGVIGDLAGLIAATYRRGVPLIQIPTTLVAQVDSSIGGKSAIDLPVAKNLIGAFYQPSMVISDSSILKTLPSREIKCGLAEIIKYSIITSKGFFDFLSNNMAFILKLRQKEIGYIVKRCCSIKSKIVSADEKDTKGIRAVLNYGHTIGHAIEAVSGYKGVYNHGEAVAIGMAAAASISNKIGMLPSNELEKIKDVIKKAGLPVEIKGFNKSRIFNAVCHDKKFIHGINTFILPVKIGRVKVVRNISKKHILGAIKQIGGL